MANPYYIPRDNSRFTDALSALKLGLDTYNSYKQQQLSEKELAMRGVQAEAERDFRSKQLSMQEKQLLTADRSLIAQQEANALKEREIIQKGGADEEPFGYVKASQTKAIFKKYFGIKDNDELVAAVDEAGKNQKITNGMFVDGIKMRWIEIKDRLLTAAAEDYVSKSEKIPNYEQTPEGKQQYAYIETVQNDETGDTVLKQLAPRTYEARQQKAAKAAKEAYIAPEKPIVVPRESSLIDPSTNKVVLQGQEKGPTLTGEAELTDRELKGDKQAQAILDTMQKRKLETAAAQRTIIDNSKAKEIDVPAMAQSVIDGQDAPVAIKGSMGNPLASKVKTEVLRKYPKFDFTMADANYKWKQSAVNQRTINFAGGALPRLSALDEQLQKLPNTDINAINRVMSVVSKEFGKPEYTNFESNRNAIVQEVNTALSGSSQSSDMRVKIELDNLKSARSPAQIKGAISNLREALIARVDVDLSPLYPIEVVRGEKTMQQYKDEMFKKYRGNYGPASMNQKPSSDMDNFWKK